MIPKTECKDRQLYRIRSRNLSFGIYCAETGGFIGLREKWESIYLFTEYHHDNGPPYGTVTPIEELSDELPAEIENREVGQDACWRCDVPVEYVKWPEGGEREVSLPSKTLIKVPGEWKHTGETACQEVSPCVRENQSLRKWLDEAIDRFYKRNFGEGETTNESKSKV